jgi:hypothetical protein
MESARSPVATCRELAARVRFGALATLHAWPRGEGGAVPSSDDVDLWPFASLVAVASDDRGRPLLLLSRLAEHTKNLERCPRASLLLSAPDEPAGPLAGARMTILGALRPVADADRAGAAAAYLAVHPDAATPMGFGDFALWRMDVEQVRWVAGFGRMGWVAGVDYCATSAPASPGGAADPR